MTPHGDLRVAKAFRIWLGMEVMFGLATLLSLGRFPDETVTRFAWPIVPTVTAAVLGGLYLSLVPTLVLALFARRWAMIRVIVLPAWAFTTAELVATILHWDKFSTGTLPFNVWFASYILPPPIFLAGYLWHQRRFSASEGQHLRPRLRSLLLPLGGLLTADAIVGFVYPPWLMGSFPWTLTPLTTRVLCGWLILLGTLLLAIGFEDDPDRVRLASPFLMLVLPLFVIQLLRYRSEVDASNPRLWTALALFGIVFGVGLSLVRGSWGTSLR